MGEADDDRLDAGDGRGQPDRKAQPVDAEQPPRLAFPVVGIGASAGGLEAVSEFLGAMPADGGMAFVLIQHLAPNRESMMADILGKRTAMPVREVEDGIAVEVNHVYVIRPGHVLTIRDGRLHLGPELGGPRAANRPIDDFFKSLAEEQRERAVCVVMSGMGSNGSAGAQTLKAVGGLCVAQEPESAQFPSMPRHLIESGNADYILRPAEMPDVLLAYAGHPYARGGRELDAAALLRRNQGHLRDVLTVLRTRTRQEFNGYKKPTILRRIQRRMGLTRVTDMGDYVKLLRQSPGEVTALADDLLIHVTGFFRDPEAWDALRERVIVPLVAAREPDGQIRCWVTACSTGDEAYTLAILLTEAAERANKRLDIKVFATDMADRTLSQARAGLYPGGIEAEVSPERLGRFFVKEDAVYRVRPELRERVVFAPQNVLRDPPFSRLDIATCRNLLIYLEPEVQERVLGLLHFGLREGGALFLGTSETIGAGEGLFEPLDKKAKIFRRVGPTRHGSVEFPLPHSLGAAVSDAPRVGISRSPGTRSNFGQITQRTLLEHHLPAAVLVDRDYRIQYFQGDTRPFIGTPRGEPTRDLMELAVDGVRGAARVALRRAAADNASATVLDGWVMTEPGRRSRVAVTATPAADAGAPDHFVISFELRGDVPAGAPPADGAAEDAGGDGDDQANDSEDVLRRVREELQSTIEELQTANEEMKAAAEEASSVNEELQSSNEELETSKEEMQSLNEELSTVNAQLQARMAEHQATANDLASLLASTDIPVLFLDRQMRIRRFTPPVRDLIDLLASDVGRPLSDFARKFTDPELTADAEAVLERLIPVEREIASAAGRWYQRRITPYRTADNRIDGVVIAFVDVTQRKKAEAALRDGETKYRTLFESMDEGFCIVEMLYDDAGRPVDYRFVEVNPAFERHTGLAAAAGRTVRELVPTHDDHWFEVYGRVADTGEPVRLQQASAALGRHYDVYAFRAGAAGERRVAVIFTDITERKRAEDRQAFRLKLSDALRTLADSVAIEVEATRVLGEHLGVDRAFYAEVEPDEDHIVVHRDYRSPGTASIAGRLSIAAFGPHWSEGYRAGRTLATSDAREVAGAQPSAFEAAGFRACVGVPVKKGGKLGGLLVVQSAAPRQWTPLEVALIEETAERTWAAVERTKAGAALRESEALYRAIAANLPSGAVFVVDRDLRYRLADGRALRDAGFEPADLEGRTVREAMPADVADRYEPNYRAALAGQPFNMEHDDHGRRYVTHGVPLPSASGGIDAVLAVSYDITDRKRAEEALRVGEEQFRLLVEGARDYAMLMLDPDGRISAWNAGAERLFGLTEAEAVGQDGAIIFTPEDRAAGAPAEELALAKETGRAGNERWHVKKGDERFWGSGAVTALRNPDGSLRGLVKVMRDETARKRAEELTQAARAAAELANRMKDEFLATVSHELRTPLSSILIWSKMIGRQAAGAGLEFAEGIEAITRSAEAQKQLIDDLLDTSRITSGKLRLDLRPVELAAVVSAAVESVVPTAEAKHLAVSVDAGADVGVVRADPDRLRQVVWNLLTNAIKFTPEGGRVDVGLRRRGGTVEIRVADTGRGIDPAFLPHVFEAFRQADAATTRTHGGLGLGLGLAICKQLVEQHGGTIAAESPGPNLGATFTIRLPLPKVRATRPPKGAGRGAPERATPPRGPPLDGVRILLVEDEADTRKALLTLLGRAGATVTAVDSAAAAIEAFRRSRPDLLVSDVGLPGEDGYSLIEKVRASQAAGGDDPVPALALTAFARDEDRARALAAGFDQHLGKPGDPEQLVSILRSLVDGH